ncbi:nickel-responsive transcriptional regulator NikR [Variovorax dokdonensis]|uniref:Putative nickel-responsive regulator n=1 Tax=Variovorax dokdonensis TaxID=344883 RepID=A0ABT7N5Q0_9BURK|nr:nickel-responsive transcriptional regulator NikR [Variovorax dokdonensis]MDM0043257.1 nickel-responsive transcriptional regulator NikR [Variovorax dokdonensis]
MQRFTISLDDNLAHQFDEFIAARGYVNRSEAVRDLIRSRLGDESIAGTQGPQAAGRKTGASWCVASVSYVFDHHEQTVTSRLLDLQHDHHDLVVSSLHTHLDHHHCMESVVLRGPTAAVRACADAVVALRGVRHGQVNLIPLDADGQGPHRHDESGGVGRHVHFKPIN